MVDPFVDLDATAQAELVQKGEASPLELVDAAISRVEQLNPQLNAVIHPLFEKARGQATAAELPTGPFRGVPFVMKDLIGGPAGEPLHNGMQLLKKLGYTSPQDTYLSMKFRQAGFISIGRTNTPEWGLMGTTEPDAYGPTHNPWNLAHSSGGSSGGSAAAVAARARRHWPRRRWRRLATHSSQHVWHRGFEAKSWTHLFWSGSERGVGWHGKRGRYDTLGPRHGKRPRRHGRTHARRSVQCSVSGASVPRGSRTKSWTLADRPHAANSRQCLSSTPSMYNSG